MVNGKVPLAQLLQQIADLVTSGEDSGSQASDGSVPVRLRSVVLALLDQVAANTSVVRPREVGSILRLVHHALARMPSMFAGDNRGVLAEVLERIIPMLGRPQLADVRQELVQTCTKILQLLATVSSELFVSVAKGFWELFEDTYGVALVLSMQPEMSATLSCFGGVLGEADSAAAAALQLPLDSSAACEMLLANVLAIVAQVVAVRPMQLAPLFAQPNLARTRSLLLANSSEVQVGAMRLLKTLLLAAPYPPIPLLDVLEAMKQMLQQGVPSPTAAANSSIRQDSSRAEEDHWWQELLGLLHAVLDSSMQLGHKQVLPIVGSVGSLALQSVQLAAGLPEVQVQLCQLLKSTAAQHPQAGQAQHAQQLVQLLRIFCCEAGPSQTSHAAKCCGELCGAMVLLLGQYSSTQVQGVLDGAAGLSGQPGEAGSPEGRTEEDPAIPTARKRRRLRLTPQRATAPTVQNEGALGTGQPAPPADLLVLGHAVLRAATEAQARLCHPDILPLAGTLSDGRFFVALLNVLGAGGVSLAQLLNLCLPVVPSWLGVAPSSLEASPPHKRQALLQACEGLLTAITSASQLAMATGTSAAVSLANVAPAQLQVQLEQAWEAATIWEGPPAEQAHALGVVLSVTLAATQANLLDGADFLTHIFSKVHQELQHSSAEGNTGSWGDAVQRTFSLLLPAACVVAGAREDAHHGSQPRATQGGGRRQMAASQAQHRQGNLLVALLQQELESLEAGMAGTTVEATSGKDNCQHGKRAQHSAAAGIAHGLLPVLRLAHQPTQMVELAVQLALSESAGTWRPVRWSASTAADCQPVLASAVADWTRLALEQLCLHSHVLGPQAQVHLIEAVASFLLHAAPGQLEHSRPLASWALKACSSPHAAVRAAASQLAATVLAAPQVILALYHEGPHPIHTKDRALAVEGYDHKVLQALKSQLEAADSQGARECILQVIGQVGSRLGSHNAHLLMLAILVLSLDSQEPWQKAAAAEVLAGVAEQRHVSLRDLLFGSPRLLELVGRNLPARPALLAELADLLEMGPRVLAQALLPHALPAVVSREGLEALAAQAGLEPRRLLQDYGHHAVAKQLFDGSDSFDGFVAFTEAVMGQDFVVFVRSIMPRTIMEIVMQAGNASDWGTGVPVPEGILQRASSMLRELSGIAFEGKEAVSVAEFLADGDHVTRTLKEFGDLLDKRLLPSHSRPNPGAAAAASAVTVLRCLALLIQLTGSFIGRFLPQLMVLLTSALRPPNQREIKLQGLEGWHMLVHSLAKHAPLQLGGIVNQVVVALMDCLQELGPVCAAASRVIEDVVGICKRHQPGKLRGIPPLPPLQELECTNRILKEERGQLSITEHIELLILSLGEQSLSVRAVALQELQTVLHKNRGWASRVLAGGGAGGQSDGKHESALLARLLSALLKCCDPERHNMASLQAQQACAECLGLLGAVDPSRVQLDLQPPPTMCRSEGDLVITLVTRHLLRLLKTASSLQVLDAATFAIQELLKHYARHDELARHSLVATEGQRSREGTPVDGNALFNALPQEVQAIVRPYLESKYSVLSTGRRGMGVVFKPSISFRRWMSMWMEQMVQHFVSGPRVKLFKSSITVFRHDVPASLFLLPYLVHNVVACGSDAACQSVQQELEAVLRGGALSREGGLCMQAVFSLLDVLHKWGEDVKTAESRGGGDSGSGADASMSQSWDRVRQLLNTIPKDLLAQAASQCGAHARALQYYETHVRASHNGGGLNPGALTSAQYSDADVSFLLEVYGRLEEPDGLEGLVKLRQGGARPEDQRLAAEKAGNWAEAATLYEQALQHVSGVGAQGVKASVEEGMSPTQLGYLGCLLQMGHLHGLLAQVEGLAATCDDVAALQLASLGTAAAWRLGRWALLEGHLRVADDLALPAAMGPDARWEVRLGRLLWAASRHDEASLRLELESARAEVMGPFAAAAMESYSRAYPHLVKLHMLQEVADVAGLLHKPLGPHERQRQLRWEERLGVTQSSLATQEPILALRRQLANLSGASAEAVGQCWLQLARLCRMTGHYDAATTAVLEAMSCKASSAGLESVMLLWEKGEQHRAVTELQQLELRVCPKGEAGAAAGKPEHSRYQAQVVLQLAQWMASTGQGFKDEIQVLFNRACTYDGSWEAVYFRYAAYLDQLMTDAKRRQEGSEKTSSKMDRLGGKSRIRLGEDRPHIEYLPDVVYQYGNSVLHGHAHIYQALPRLLTLWFELGSYVQSYGGRDPPAQERKPIADVHQHMRDFAKRIPLHLWLTALPQLISRMCHSNKQVGDVTKGIISKILEGYPQQCLWALSAVAKSNMSARRSAFAAITQQVKKHGSDSTKRLITEHMGLWDQLIKVCHHNPTDKRSAFSAKKEFSHLFRTMPLNVMIPVMSGEQTVGTCICTAQPPLFSHGRAELTVTLPPSSVSAAGSEWRGFGEPVTFEAMVDEVALLQSLQKPKKVKFVGSDGREYCFLAKPKDDLRKDNRMMEAAGILNRLFAEDPGARRRSLYLRRFAVIPLTEDTGLVEWVPNTTGLRHCLQEIYTTEGIFQRSTHQTIRKMYDGFTGKRRAELLDKVLAMFPPRFHKWQLAKFPEPAAWLNARLAFTRTAAVWSMVGHVVGLGDRHGENILIDMSNGDVVHVDFSCLFDRGLTLEKPEMVPFRLTQNMIDGFGVTGHEGLYRRACETTMKVLRANVDTIMSVMDTFVHDPLVEWSRGAPQRADAEAENPMAKDALATIEGRLMGTLLGVSSQPCLPLSVEGHAHRLIAEATDKENLGQILGQRSGWKSWKRPSSTCQQRPPAAARRTRQRVGTRAALDPSSLATVATVAAGPAGRGFFELCELAFAQGLSQGRLPPAEVVNALASKVPQILDILRAKSARGLSASSFELETAGLLIATSYGFLLHLPISAFGESVALLVQNSVIVLLIHQYKDVSPARKLGFLALLLSWAALSFSGVITRSHISLLYDFNNLLLVGSKVPQILENFNSKSTGHLSPITCFFNWFGACIRIFTSVQERAGAAMIRGSSLNCLLNFLVLAQIFFYRNSQESRKKEGWRH
ncbi:hypothetical protein N2152v2_004402 [Parachlorella kessleri]